MSINTEVAKTLLNLGCVTLSPKNPYTYASGLKGPIYCDNRKIISDIEARNLVCNAFVDLIKRVGFDYDSIAGLATAGIPHGMLVADRLESSFVYVRSKPKAHGKGEQVEGSFQENDKLILIEDLVNQGKSLEDAVTGVKNAKLSPIACLCIVDYQTPAAITRSKELSLPIHSLTQFSNLVDTAVTMGLIDSEDKKLLEEWHVDPKAWSAKH